MTKDAHSSIIDSSARIGARPCRSHLFGSVASATRFRIKVDRRVSFNSVERIYR